MSSNWVEEIQQARKDKLIGREILFFDRVDSTNRVARDQLFKEQRKE